MGPHICLSCGVPLKKDGNSFLCPHCGAIYDGVDEESVAKAVDQALSDAKREALASAKGLLWDTLHAKYPSRDNVMDAAKKVLILNPEDHLATIALASHNADPHDLNHALSSLDVTKAEANEILTWCLRSLSARTAGAIHDFADRHFHDAEKVEWITKIEEETDKLKEGFYETSLPRDVFLCYSSADMKRVVPLLDLLEANGFVTFAAFRNLRHGKGAQESYLSLIKEAMSACSVVVFVSTNASRTVTCDALKVELPYLIANFPNKPRIEYVLEDYDPNTPFMVKRTLKMAFPEQEYCRDEEDLLVRIANHLENASQPEKEAPRKEERQNTDSQQIHDKAIALFEEGDFEKSFPALKKAAELGYPDAQYNLGWCYSHGKGVEQDDTEAIHWYKKAAEGGDSQGQYILGWCYFYGKKVEEDHEKAAHWYQKAAEQGHGLAQYELGFCYLNGDGVFPNEKEAARWFKKAADQGDEDALTAYNDLQKQMGNEQ